MPDRRDAFLAAAEIALAVEAAARSTGARSTPWRPVGVCDVFPGAVNSIPSRVRMEVDVRDIDSAPRPSCPAIERCAPTKYPHGATWLLICMEF